MEIQRDIMTKEQMRIAEVGLKNGLSEEQVAAYDKPEFDADQMAQAMLGFRDGLSIEQVESYYKPEYSGEQMEQAREGLEHKLNEKQVAAYYKPEFNAEQMAEARRAFLEEELSKEQVGSYFGSYYRPEYTAEQIKEARYGLQLELSEQQIAAYYNPAFTAEQMREAREGFYDGLSMEKVKSYYKLEYTAEQMREARYGLYQGLSRGQIATYYKPEVGEWKMGWMRIGMAEGWQVPRLNAGYAITDSLHIGESELVIGEMDTKYGKKYVTWECSGGNDYNFGHYFDSREEAERDFLERSARSEEAREGLEDKLKEKGEAEAATVQGMTVAALDRAIEDALDEAELNAAARQTSALNL